MIEQLSRLNTILKDLNNVNETQLKKEIYSILREGIKNHQYEISIDNYLLNIDPNDISIKYEIPSTLIEIDSDSVYYELERDLDIEYFCVSDKKDNYPLSTPTIQVSGHILNINGNNRVDYVLDFLNSNDQRISNYIIRNQNTEVVTDESAVISFDVKDTTPIIDFTNYLDLTKLVPVYLQYKENTYINRELNNIDETYSKYIPDVSKKIVIMKKICNYIIEFYNEYASKLQ